jgi:hypothetical protein
MSRDFYSPSELAQLLAITLSAIERMRERGSGPPYYRVTGGPSAAGLVTASARSRSGSRRAGLCIAANGRDSCEPDSTPRPSSAKTAVARAPGQRAPGAGSVTEL